MIKDIIANPKKMFKKKFFLILKFMRLPYPDIDNESRIILIMNISIWKKIINFYL